MKKKTKQAKLSAWATSTTNSNATSSSTTASKWTYPTTATSTWVSSSTTAGWPLDDKASPLKENQEIEVTLQDGTEVTMTLKNYMAFVAYNKMVPSDCKNIEEYNEKMLVLRI